MEYFNPKKPFSPPKVTLEALEKIQVTLTKDILNARVAIAQLNGFINGVPSSTQALLNPIYLNEALASSKIENINTTLIEVMQRQIVPNQKQDNNTLVLNYFSAMMWGLANLPRYGITTRLFVGLHNRLHPGGENDYRKIQNIIADGRGTVRYTPPEAQNIPALIGQLEKLVNDQAIKSKIDPLVVAAVAHYYFEAIHPFGDGNGRTGRIILTLQLVENKLIGTPSVHISQFINRYRSKYYDLLINTTIQQDYFGIAQFVIQGFSEQANHAFHLLQKIQTSKIKMHNKVKEALPKIYRQELIDKLFEYPVITPVALGLEMKCHYVTSSKYLHELKTKGFLTSTKVGRNVYYANHSLLKLLSDEGKMQ